MNREDLFVRALALCESGDNVHAWGDAGRAFGRFQWHFPTILEWLRDHPMLWTPSTTVDEVCTYAVRCFHRAALAYNDKVTDAQIAMAYHLHGRIRFTGWDPAYREKFDRAMEQALRESSN